MKKLLSAIWSAISKVWGARPVEWSNNLQLYSLTYALPIVRTITQLTPNKADDEIVALFEKYALPGVQDWLKLPPSERGLILLYVARSALRRVLGDVTSISFSKRELDLMVQSAVTATDPQPPPTQ